MKRFILFLIRKRLGVKKFQKFQFTNQKYPEDWYYFTDIGLMKQQGYEHKLSGVGLNWLLDDLCSYFICKEEDNKPC